MTQNSAAITPVTTCNSFEQKHAEALSRCEQKHSLRQQHQQQQQYEL